MDDAKMKFHIEDIGTIVVNCREGCFCITVCKCISLFASLYRMQTELELVDVQGAERH